MFSNDSNDAVCQGRRPGALTRLCTLRTRARLRSRANEADRRRGRESRGSLPPPFLPFAFGRRPRAPAAATTLPTAAALPQDAEEPFVFRRVRLDSLQYPIYIHRGISARPGRDGRLLGSPPSPTWCWGGGGIKCGSSVACLHKSGNVALPVTERCPPVARPALQSIKLPTGASGHGSRGGGLLRLRPVSSPPSAPVSGSGASLMHTHDRRRPRSSTRKGRRSRTSERRPRPRLPLPPIASSAND